MIRLILQVQTVLGFVFLLNSTVFAIDDPCLKDRLLSVLDIYEGENYRGSRAFQSSRVRYLTPEKRADYLLSFEKKQIFFRGKPIHTSPFGSIDFVLDQENRFLAFYNHSNNGAGKFHHSSLVGGAPVLSAGSMYFENGILIKVTDQSGHYLPNAQAFHHGLLELQKRGIDLDDVEIGVSGLQRLRNSGLTLLGRDVVGKIEPHETTFSPFLVRYFRNPKSTESNRVAILLGWERDGKLVDHLPKMLMSANDCDSALDLIEKYAKKLGVHYNKLRTRVIERRYFFEAEKITKRIHWSEYTRTDRNLAFMQKRVYPKRILDLDALKKKKVLDAGCGNGAFVKDLRAHQIDAVGVDMQISPKQKKNSHFLVHGDLVSLPFNANQFDEIFSSFTVFLEVYEGKNRPFIQRVLLEFKRVLKPGGEVVIGGTHNPIVIELANELGFTLVEKGTRPELFLKFAL